MPAHPTTSFREARLNLEFAEYDDLIVGRGFLEAMRYAHMSASFRDSLYRLAEKGVREVLLHTTGLSGSHAQAVIMMLIREVPDAFREGVDDVLLELQMGQEARRGAR